MCEMWIYIFCGSKSRCIWEYTRVLMSQEEKRTNVWNSFNDFGMLFIFRMSHELKLHKSGYVLDGWCGGK